ncbi:MAG TPA: protein kinase [Candidatus Acidoferrales bacterium]|nr:protein kinase [Candidatus Acidoferrales bacterium]
MECPVCAEENAEQASQCSKCHTPLPGSLSQETLQAGAAPDRWSIAVGSPPPAGASEDSGQLEPGTVLAGRYEILQLLGQGGMGAVYKAHDLELERLVALKLIRTELGRNPEILRRFKQELILARQVTHKNVIRIFDLGQSDGIKFITMDFVEGRDLRSLISEKGKFAPEDAARIMVQICRGLEAAHTEGVIHRDLKPQNIMLDANQKVYVMDFGIARSAYLPGMTQTGALIGTPEYMSPEQARGEKLTAQSDLFSLGVIFYELLTGVLPYQSDTPLATLWKRMQEKPKPPIEVDPTIPQVLNDIVLRAMEIEPANRFATVGEIADALEAWLGVSRGTTVVKLVPAATSKWRWTSVGLASALVLVVAASVYWFFFRSSVAAKHAPVSVLVADFENHTGDPVFDNTLEPMFNIALEGASFINAFNRGEARKIAKQSQPPSDKLDEQSARLIAVSQGISAVVTGSLSLRDNGYLLSVDAIDATTGKTLRHAQETVANKDDVTTAIPELAAPIRKALGDRTPESVQLAKDRGTFTSSSLEAVHDYGLGMEQQFAGKMDDAFQSFSKAAELDPNFARAYAGMAGMAGNLNRPQDAQKYLQLAMEHVDRMTERERYRTRGLYYRRTGNLQKCVEEYSELVKQFPADNIGHQNLANCYSDLRNAPKAIEEQSKAVEISPKSAMQRRNLALLAAYGGDVQTAGKQAQAALQLNPSYERAYLPLAYSQLLQGEMDQAASTYQGLAKVSKLGASYSAAGLGDLAFYEGKFSEAAKTLSEGAAADEAASSALSMEKYTELAYIQLAHGDNKLALDAAQHASASKKTNIRFLLARIYVATGDLSKAQDLASVLAADPQPEPQADAKLIAGEIALQGGKANDAIKSFTDANQTLDTWLGRFDLGRAYLAANEFTEADSEFDRCIKRRGEALELEDSPTFGMFPPVYYYQGRVREGLKSAGAKESYKTYLNIRGAAGEDPLLAEVRRKAGQ